ncbi:uncharacterized protein LOC131039702 isoform X7 [Cryptomeria japonica]|uniref:uncharacterized protein LOC131039702 isoform X7 n=1 Tax=Cryptomeria japonica TaxID=3369 RepID=UPI0025AC2F2C|nr:uncharacterized protein LOC131039702 isoform X7 [Cryptomeria japonica]
MSQIAAFTLLLLLGFVLIRFLQYCGPEFTWEVFSYMDSELSFTMEGMPLSELKSETAEITLTIDEELTSKTESNMNTMDGIIPQLFETVSGWTHQFQDFVEDVLAEDVSAEQSSMLSSKEHSTHGSDSTEYHHLYDDSCGTSSMSANECSTSVSVRESGVITNPALLSAIDVTKSAFTEATQSFWSTPTIFKGFMFPIVGLKFAWRLAFICVTCSCFHARRTHRQLKRLVARVQTTLRGSSRDIGWLQRAPGMPPVEDGTNKFKELLERIRNGEHMLPDRYVYLLVPGLFSNHGPLYFVDTKKFFSKLGLACHIAKIHSEASVAKNAWELKQYIEELYWGSGKRVLLLGHSKGGVDAAAALAMYWPDLKEKVAGLALVQSPYGGSPIASDILREGQIGDFETRRLMELLICKLIKFGARASTLTPRSEVRRGTYTELLTSDAPPNVQATLDRGVAAAVASSEALTEALVTLERDHPPIVDEHSDYMFASRKED